MQESKQSWRQRRGDSVSSEKWKQMIIRRLCWTLCLRLRAVTCVAHGKVLLEVLSADKDVAGAIREQ